MIVSRLLKRVRLIQTRHLAFLCISCSLLSIVWTNTCMTTASWIVQRMSYDYTTWIWKSSSYWSDGSNVLKTTPTNVRNETPRKETPGSETPGSETPGSETPGSETPGSETPGSETPGSGSVHDRTGISCAAIFQNNKNEARRAEEYMQTTRRAVIWTAERYKQSTSNCTRFKLERGYITEPGSTEEAAYPIAYSIMMYKDYEQTERLLRAIYRPQNFYCIHPDAKAGKEVHETLNSVVRCFDNVFIAPKLWKVHWGHISLTYAERTCLEKLVNYSWFYFINLSGQMFPLRTNGEIVRILKLFNGSNDIEGRRAEALQFSSRYENKWRLSEADGRMGMTSEKKAPPPYNVTVYKGTNNAAISRAFALYFLYSKVARELTDYFADAFIPDEFLWPTLNRNRNLKAPGGYFGNIHYIAFDYNNDNFYTIDMVQYVEIWK